MRRISIAGRALIIFMVVALAACGSETTTDDSGTTPDGGTAGTTGTSGAPSDVPNPDTLVVTVNDDVFNLDPGAVNGNDVGMDVILNVYDRLVAIDAEDGSVIPSLATEVPTLDNGLISEDGLTYTFNLREGVVFSDGTDMTAEDFKFSWDRVVEMALPEGQSELFSNVASTTAVDDLTFEVTLNEVDASFLAFLAAHPVASVVSPDAVEANGGVTAGQPNEFMAQNMVGTGPYTLATWERGDRMTFDINPDYWGEPAHLPVRWELIVDSPAAGLQAKEFDIVDISPTDVPSFEGIEHAVVDTSVLDLQVLQIGMNMNIAEGALPEGDTIPLDFFQDVRIRQAFNYAFNYQGYIDGILGGLGGRGSFMLPVEMYGYDPDAPIYETDPAMAEQLFTEAGYWDEGFTISIMSDQTHEGFTGAALTLKDSIEALNPNFHINVLAVPEAQFDEALATDPLPMAMWSYTSSQYSTPDAYLFDSAVSDGRYGAVNSFVDGYSDPEAIDALIASARTTLDEEERLGILSEIQNVLYEEAMWIMPANEGAPSASGDWVTGHIENPMWPRPSQYWKLYDK
ncbi:MAG TPA: ABC transporter substrate-binding protein [Acidimicrobiia bacterium]|nr:ABC transporter substrate-binding protein [Acidimicrobiia bacterium]